MSHAQVYLTIKRPDGETERVDVTDKPWSRNLLRDDDLKERMLDQIRSATLKAGRGQVIDAYVVDPDADAKAAYAQVLRHRNAAASLDADGHVAQAKAQRDAADRCEARYRAEYPVHAAERDAQVARLDAAADADRQRDHADAVARALRMAD